MIPYRITVHCSATRNGDFVSIDEIRKWHIARGFDDVGYHMIIEPDGEVQKGRPLNITGAHVEGENEGNIGVCLIGTNRFTQKQFDSLRGQIDSLLMLYNINPWDIFTHNQFKSAINKGKTCPNMSINSILAWYIGHHEKAISSFLLKRGT